MWVDFRKKGGAVAYVHGKRNPLTVRSRNFDINCLRPAW